MIRVVAVVFGIAVLASGCATANPHKGAQHHGASASARRPVTKPQVLDTTSSTAPSSTTTTVLSKATTTVPKVVHAVPPPPAPTTTTTTDPPLPQCNWANFSTTVATDQAAYPQGQTVHVTLTYRNNGPSCVVHATGYGCPRVDIGDSSGYPTWTSEPQPTTGCAAQLLNPPTVLATTWSQSSPIDWTQVDCSSRTGGTTGTCAGQPVPAGQYQITGMDSGGSSQIPPSAPLSVTIS